MVHKRIDDSSTFAPGYEADGWPTQVPRPPSHAELWQEDEELESDPHVIQIFSMRDALRYRFRARPDVFIGANIPVYFSAMQVRKKDFRAPDLFAVFDAKVGVERYFWIVWEEERTPDFVLEVLSESTERIDRGRKKDIYERVLNVPEYFLFDLNHGRVEGFRLEERRYRPIAPNAAGRLASHMLGLELGVVEMVLDGREGRWLRFFEPDGRLVPTAAEAAQAEAQAAQAEAQAAQAEAQAAQAEAQAAQAEARALADKLAAYEARFGKLDQS